MIFNILDFFIKGFWGHRHVWDERMEAVKCVRCNEMIGYDNPQIKNIVYKQNSNRPYLGKIK